MIFWIKDKEKQGRRKNTENHKFVKKYVAYDFPYRLPSSSKHMVVLYIFELKHMTHNLYDQSKSYNEKNSNILSLEFIGILKKQRKCVCFSG